MDHKKEFIYPSIEIIELNENDFIITTSGDDYTPDVPPFGAFDPNKY